MGGAWRRLREEEGLLVVVVLIGNVGNFVFHIYMSRNLGADGYGALTALVSLLWLLSIPTMTIQASLAQFIAAETAVGAHATAHAFFTGGLRRVTVFAGLAGLGVVAATRPLAAYLHLDDARPVVVLAGLVALSLMAPVFWAGLQGLRLFRALGGTILVSLAIKCGLGIGLVLLGGAVSSAMLALLAAAAAALVLAHLFLRRAWVTGAAAGPAPDFRPVWQYAVPVSLGFIALAPYANLDIILARHYLSTAEAGHYASTMILGKAFLFLPVGIVLALFPNVAHAVARAEDPRAYLWPALGFGAALSLAGAIVCLLAPGLLARVLVRSPEPAILPLIRAIGFVMTPAGLATILLQYHLARRHWACLPGILCVALGFLLAVARWHASAPQVLTVVGLCSAAAFAILLLTVWWPAPRAAQTAQV